VNLNGTTRTSAVDFTARDADASDAAASAAQVGETRPLPEGSPARRLSSCSSARKIFVLRVPY